jgi:hypothetical protein
VCLQAVVKNDIVDLIVDNCELIKYQDTIERNVHRRKS